MSSKCLFITICVIAISVIGVSASLGGDLDDKLGKYTDDSIKKDDELGKADKNINFIILDAIMSAKSKGGADDAKGDKNVNSIVIKEGANLQGATIINLPGKNNTGKNTKKEDDKKRPGR